jgi:hypothetical protein
VAVARDWDHDRIWPLCDPMHQAGRNLSGRRASFGSPHLPRTQRPLSTDSLTATVLHCSSSLSARYWDLNRIESEEINVKSEFSHW